MGVSYVLGWTRPPPHFDLPFKKVHHPNDGFVRGRAPMGVQVAGGCTPGGAVAFLPPFFALPLGATMEKDKQRCNVAKGCPRHEVGAGQLSAKFNLAHQIWDFRFRPKFHGLHQDRLWRKGVCIPVHTRLHTRWHSPGDI